jgi:transcriptional regulator with XRE-family HTH domain
MTTRNNTLDAAAVGARLRQRRLELGLSQRELQIDGVSYAYISRVEQGSRSPSLTALIRLADRLRDWGSLLATENLAKSGRDELDDQELAAFQAAALTTALWLLTGNAHDQCPLCGRHDDGGSDHAHKKRPPRH